MQSSFPRPFVLLAAIALLAPSAAATWFVAGSHEPDNGLDDPKLMFFDPPGTATDRIYFNVISGMAGPIRGIMVSPNSALLQTHTEVPTQESHEAIFGVWVDCNGDGYVGLSESGLREYPANLLASTAICPPANGPTNRWTAGAHNYNGWVSELIPIAGTPFGVSANTTDLRHYRDDAAMVWGDYNRPDDAAAGGGSCPIAPQPRGTFQSTGGFLNYADCLTDAMDIANAPWSGTRLLAQDIPGLYDFGAPDLGVDFDDPNDARGHPIYDHPTLGTEDSSRAAVYVIDCSSDEPAFHSGDFFNGTPLGPNIPAGLQNMSVDAIDPRVGDVGSATVPAQVNETNEEFLDDCDTSNDAGHDFYGNGLTFYVGEDEVAAVTGANKRASSFNFQFQFWDRGTTFLGFGPAVPFIGGPAGFTVPGKPASNWNNGNMATKAPATLRVDLTEGTFEFPGAYYLTFYAHAGTNMTSRGFTGAGGDGVYGSAQCGDNDSGIHHGWNCDVATWNRNADGTPISSPTLLAAPGQVYEFRDVDCYDGSVGETGVGIGTPFFGTGPCTPTAE